MTGPTREEVAELYCRRGVCAASPLDTGDVPVVECERPAHADGHHGPGCHNPESEL